MRETKLIFLFFSLFFALAQTSWISSAEEISKRPLAFSDFDSWKSLSAARLSEDGSWLLYLELPQDGDGMLVVRSLTDDREFRNSIGYAGEGTEAGKAAKPQFNQNASHVAFFVSPDQEEVKLAKKEKKKKDKDATETKLAILDLSTGKVSIVECVKSFQFAEKESKWLVYLKGIPPQPEKKDEKPQEGANEGKKKETPKKEKERKFGTTLFLIPLLEQNKARSFESVLEYRLSKDGRTLFYIVSSKEKPETDGIYACSTLEGKATALTNGKGIYKSMAMNYNETHLAFLTNRDDQAKDEPLFSLYGWRAGEAKASPWVTQAQTLGFPQGMTISDKTELFFSDDGRRLLFGIGKTPTVAKPQEEESEEAQFELWHWNDPYPYPQQKKMAKAFRENAWEALYDTSRRSFVMLGDALIPDVQLSRNGKRAFAQTNLPYSRLASFDDTYMDVMVISPETGARIPVAKKIRGRAELSPEGGYVYWFQDGYWHIFDIVKKESRNLTAGLDVQFAQEDWDVPGPARPYGIAGWTKGESALLAYDRTDIWELAVDGSRRRRLTEGIGRKSSISFRYLKTDEEERTIELDKPMLLSATHEETMASGFYRDRVLGDSPPQQLIEGEASFAFVGKAKRADRLLYTRSRFDQFPDLWVSDGDFKSPRKVTVLDKQMDPFLWGKAELRTFFSIDHRPLKGILIKPASFDPSKKYALLVYIYETLHTGLHNFRHPAPGTSINFPYCASNGYLIWMPDIEYTTGYPGQDALKCVLPGIDMLIGEGFVDRKAIGIQGHSWGGYQIAYLVTRTNLFAAAEAGAPVSNMVSAYDGIRWESGMVRQWQYEKSQSRIGSSLWESPLRFIENSPIFWADKVQTPLLILHNDNDGAVPWYQGIELIMALTRLGKVGYLFNYNGEEHGLRKRLNQKDWSIHLVQFFDHYLKGAPMADWMKSGIPAWDKKEKPESEKLP